MLLLIPLGEEVYEAKAIRFPSGDNAAQQLSVSLFVNRVWFPPSAA